VHSEAVKGLVGKERCTGEVSRVLKNRDEQVECEDERECNPKTGLDRKDDRKANLFGKGRKPCWRNGWRTRTLITATIWCSSHDPMKNTSIRTRMRIDASMGIPGIRVVSKRSNIRLVLENSLFYYIRFDLFCAVVPVAGDDLGDRHRMDLLKFTGKV